MRSLWGLNYLGSMKRDSDEGVAGCALRASPVHRGGSGPLRCIIGTFGAF